MNGRIAWAFVIVVGAGWFLAEVVFPVAIRGYTPPAGLSAAVGSVSGVVIALMAAQASQRRNGDQAEQESKQKRKERHPPKPSSGEAE